MRYKGYKRGRLSWSDTNVIQDSKPMYSPTVKKSIKNGVEEYHRYDNLQTENSTTGVSANAIYDPVTKHLFTLINDTPPDYNLLRLEERLPDRNSTLINTFAVDNSVRSGTGCLYMVGNEIFIEKIGVSAQKYYTGFYHFNRDTQTVDKLSDMAGYSVNLYARRGVELGDYYYIYPDIGVRNNISTVNQITRGVLIKINKNTFSFEIAQVLSTTNEIRCISLNMAGDKIIITQGNSRGLRSLAGAFDYYEYDGVTTTPILLPDLPLTNVQFQGYVDRTPFGMCFTTNNSGSLAPSMLIEPDGNILLHSTPSNITPLTQLIAHWQHLLIRGNMLTYDGGITWVSNPINKTLYGIQLENKIMDDITVFNYGKWI